VEKQDTLYRCPHTHGGMCRVSLGRFLTFPVGV